METIRIRFIDYNNLSINVAFIQAYGIVEAIEKIRVMTDYKILVLECSYVKEQHLLEEIISKIMDQYL